MKNYRRNNYIGKMKKGFKQKLSLLMIACLLFTGYRGLTISGRADSSHTEQNNEIEVSGTQVKVQLLGADLRRAATEAILKGEKVGKSNLRSYSKDQELATEFEEYFDGEKEIYNIPLNSIAENLEESLNAEEAGLQIYVERDAKNLDRLVRKESKESLLLYSKESAVAGLLPKKEEATTVSLTEEKASDSNLERNTELTGSELITFVYENKSTERMTFQLSVDGNKYPKVTVASKTSLFKQFLGDAKKAQAEAKNAKATEVKAESTEAQTVEASKVEESSAEAKQEVAESKATEASKATEESKASEEARKDDSEVAIVSTAAEVTEAETTEVKAEVKAEASEEATEAKAEAAEAEVKETAAKAETAQAEKATEAQKAVVEDSSLLRDITEHSEEILPELQSIRFTQYSLNELGRKSQNVEIEGFGNVQVFYDEAAFDGDVVLEAKRLFKPEEEAEGEKLSEEQVKILKDEALYDDSASLDIRFVDKKDSTVEVEPKSPVAVRITIEKKALPEEAKAEDISIHHIVEEKGTEQPVSVETVSRSDKEKGAETNLEVKATEEKEVKVADSEGKISKEFTVNSFSAYVVSWKRPANNIYGKIRFHFVDQNFKEIAPTVYTTDNWLTKEGQDTETWIYENRTGKPKFQWESQVRWWPLEGGLLAHHNLLQNFEGYKFKGLYAQPDGNAGHPYVAEGMEVTYLSNQRIYWKQYGGEEHQTLFTKDCNVNEFYFVYTMCKVNKCKADMNFTDPELMHDKYITKRDDGTYDLTLTAQTRKKSTEQKTKLDVLFIYDNSGNISSQDAEKAKNKVYGLMDELTKEKSGFDARFALVSMNGEQTPSYNARDLKAYTEAERNGVFNKNDQAINDIYPIVGTLGNLNGTATSPGYTIKDGLYNDLRTYEFSDKNTIKTEIQNLPKPGGSASGANFAAAIRDAKSLMNWWDKSGNPHVHRDSKGNLISDFGYFQVSERYPDGSTQKTNNENLYWTHKNSLVRKDAKAVVVLITGGNPSKTYIPKDGVYDNYIKKDGQYYLTRTKYKKGQSIGTGEDTYYPALNDAKKELKYFVSLDAFYTVGVGNSSKWNKLSDLTSVVPEGTVVRNFDGSNDQQLFKSFKELEGELAEAQIHSIEIEDTLSENVALVNGDSSIKGVLVKMKPNKVEEEKILTEAEQKALGLNAIQVTQGPNENNTRTVLKLKTDPADFVLPLGYELRLVANVKPTDVAYKNMAKKQKDNNLDVGEARTDLNDIYFKELSHKKGDDAVYGTSVNQKGLFTNDVATITHKVKPPKGGDLKPPSEKYNKPIIKVEPRGYLRINKFFEGFDERLYRKSTGEWTDLGKVVLKNINFKIYRRDAKGEELLTTINLGDDRWINDTEAFRNGKAFKVDNYDIFINKIEDKENRETFQITIDNLPMNQNYRIVEEVLNPNSVLKGRLEDMIGYQYLTVDHGLKTQQYNYITGEGQSYEFTNKYKKVEPPKMKVIVKKEVQEIGKIAFTKEAREKKFDFYLALYDNQHKAYSQERMQSILNGLDEKLINKIKITQIPNPENVQEIISVFTFKLSHDEQIEIPLENGQVYRVIEKKVEGYDKAKVTYQKGYFRSEVPCEVFDKNGVYYSCTGYLSEEKEITKFINPKSLPVPTGIVRDITPYLFGIFGFVAMAGAYLTISKKRREV